jgi:hypothetical protein
MLFSEGLLQRSIEEVPNSSAADGTAFDPFACDPPHGQSMALIIKHVLGFGQESIWDPIELSLAARSVEEQAK